MRHDPTSIAREQRSCGRDERRGHTDVIRLRIGVVPQSTADLGHSLHSNDPLQLSVRDVIVPLVVGGDSAAGLSGEHHFMSRGMYWFLGANVFGTR